MKSGPESEVRDNMGNTKSVGVKSVMTALNNPKATTTFITHKMKENVIHMALGDLNEIGVDLNGKPTGKSMLESARADLEKDLRNGFDIEHSGLFGPKGAIESIEWTADWIKNMWGNYVYAEWGKDSNGWFNDTVRGTLERTLRVGNDCSIVSSKKTYRKPF